MRLLKIVETLRGGPRAASRRRRVANPALQPAACIAAARFCPPDARECLQKPTKAYGYIPRGWRRMLTDVDTDVHAHVDGCSRMLTKVDISHPSPVDAPTRSERRTRQCLLIARGAREMMRKGKARLVFSRRRIGFSHHSGAQNDEK